VFVAGTRPHPRWVRPWVMVERGGVRTAVIGVALQTTPEIVLAGRTAGLEFGPEAPAVDAAAREARAAGADFVVVTAHLGAACERAGSEPEEASSGCSGEALEMARALTEPVDLVVGGHTHRRVLATVDSIPFAEAASYSLAYSVTDLERRDGRTRVTHRSVQVPWADQVTPDTQVARIVSGWEARVRPVTERTIATSAVAFAGRGGGEYPLGNLLADAHRVQTGAEASLVNNGSIRRDLPAGPLSWGTLFELQPFQNALVTLRVSGAQLKAALENAVLGAAPDAHISGMTVTWNPAAPAGRRVREVRLSSGRVVTDADTVTLAATEFLAGGGDRFTSLIGAPRTATAWVDLDALIAYLQSLPQPVAAPAIGRWRTGP
jgi:2',3'-cyclic-nucleotide 2'-phosphodiesterase (5'-nucleotidase family)